MSKFVKSFKKSKIKVYTGLVDSTISCINELDNIISVDNLGGIIVIEYIDSAADWLEYIGCNNNTTNTTTSAIPKDVEDALNTIVNTDPFRLGARGMMLRDIYKTLPKWLDVARSKLKNEFILRRINIIDEYIKSQKKPVEVDNEDIFD